MTERKMLTDYPHLVAEWDDEKNSDVDMEQISYGSNKKVWWKCSVGHSFQSIVANRTLGSTQCSECVSFSQRMRLSSYPNLTREFSDENVDSPDDIRVSERKPYIWVCNVGHVWKCSVKKRIHENTVCYVCDNPDNFLISYDHLMNEWSKKLNKDIDPRFLTVGSSKIKPWWKCSVCDHVWQSSVSNRLKRGTGCVMCHKASHQDKQRDKSLLKYGSVADNKVLFPEWDSKVNKALPSDVSMRSTSVFSWVCEKGHQWTASPQRRVSTVSGCPNCASRNSLTNYHLSRIESGVSMSLYDVLTDELRNEWFDDTLDATKMMPYTHQKVQWRCSTGHVWKSSPGNRLAGRGCPDCWASSYVSSGEQELMNYVKNIYRGDILGSCRKVIAPYELDIFLPEINMAFEFNGTYWHSDKIIKQRTGMSAYDYHVMKHNLCTGRGIELFFVWEHDWVNKRDAVMNFILSVIEQKVNVL